ncbi:MAG: hypothetical protein ABFD16_01110, partial [Thermoguttaceae bacterium]
HGLTIPLGAEKVIKGGWLAFGHPAHVYRSEMAQNFWTAIYAWSTCFVVTILISLLTRRNKTDEELKGLVYSLTPKPEDSEHVWYKRPVTLALVVLVMTVLLNFVFF